MRTFEHVLLLDAELEAPGRKSEGAETKNVG